MTPIRSAVVVGGGAIGCGIARELAGRGIEVTVVERAEPGAEASGAAAGLLAPQAEGLPPGPLFDLAIKSRGLYPEWSRQLADETGIDVGWRPIGILRCDLSGASDFSRFDWQREAGLALALAVEQAGPERIGELGGGLVSAEARRALFFSQDAIVDPRRLTRALWRSAERRGVRFRLGVRALAFRIEAGRCRGVQTDAGAFEADCVVDAAGAWAAFDRAIAREAPVEPVRGQIVDLRPVEGLIPCVVQSDEVYLVPRPDGSLLVGSTTEHVGFHKEVTAEAIAFLIRAACRLVPSLARAHFAGAWAGLRPGSPDELPILGPATVEGLFLATGHYRNGILLAPVTALLIAEAVLGGSPRTLRAFLPDRFSPARAGESGHARAGGVFG